MTGNQFIKTERIITHLEWAAISDALYYIRKSYNAPNKTDEERLKDMELYLNVASGLCGEIRKRWEK
jgi:hypothetical protein